MNGAAETERRLDVMQDQIATLDRKFDMLAASFDDLSRTVEARLERVEARLGSIDETLGEILARLPPRRN
jgi:hypothetical protein